VLQERAAAGKLRPDTPAALRKVLAENPDVTRQLRALWALYGTGGADEKLLLELMDRPQEYLRAWAVRLALEDRNPSAEVRRKLARMAAEDASAFVRLHLASGLQRLPPEQRWPVAEALVAHGEDAADAYLPGMIWYGIEPLAEVDPERFVGLVVKSKIPLVRENIARRVASLAR
jgi:hypothetical protein